MQNQALKNICCLVFYTENMGMFGYITTHINGDEVEFLCDTDQTVLDVLRDELTPQVMGALRASGADSAALRAGNELCVVPLSSHSLEALKLTCARLAAFARDPTANEGAKLSDISLSAALSRNHAPSRRKHRAAVVAGWTVGDAELRLGLRAFHAAGLTLLLLVLLHDSPLLRGPSPERVRMAGVATDLVRDVEASTAGLELQQGRDLVLDEG